jgi:hypothetical protein
MVQLAIVVLMAYIYASFRLLRRSSSSIILRIRVFGKQNFCQEAQPLFNFTKFKSVKVRTDFAAEQCWKKR